MTPSLDLFTLADFACRAADEATIQQWQRHGLADLRPRHLRLLNLIRDRVCTSTEVAQLLGVTQQATSRSIVELVSAGLVDQRSSAPDRRVRRLVLTDKGKEAMAMAHEVRTELAREIVGVDGIESAQQLSEALMAFGQAHRARVKVVLSRWPDEGPYDGQ